MPVARGPYRFLRHPNYLAVAGELIAVAMMTGSRLGGPIALIGFSLLMLKRILVEPKNALVKQYQRLFKMENVDLTLAEDALGAISRKAIERKAGARGLRSIMEAILLDSMFELPSLKGVEEVVISPEVIEGNAKPLRIYAERLDESSA